MIYQRRKQQEPSKVVVTDWFFLLLYLLTLYLIKYLPLNYFKLGIILQGTFYHNKLIFSKHQVKTS